MWRRALVWRLAAVGLPMALQRASQFRLQPRECEGRVKKHRRLARF
jgi:hypothetical protein